MQPRESLVVQGLRLSTFTALGLDLTQGSTSDQGTKILPAPPQKLKKKKNSAQQSRGEEEGQNGFAAPPKQQYQLSLTDLSGQLIEKLHSQSWFLSDLKQFSPTILFPSHLSKTISNHCLTSQQPEAVTTTRANKRVIKKLKRK